MTAGEDVCATVGGVPRRRQAAVVASGAQDGEGLPPKAKVRVF
jgi:hypothetical protein